MSSKFNNLSWRLLFPFFTLCYLALPSSCIAPATARSPAHSTPSNILVVGSLNVDIIIPVHRLPQRGETITARNPNTEIAVGGKGANQAVAAAKLSAETGKRASFICKFGNDAYAKMLESALVSAGVDVSGCSKASNLPSGQGIVHLELDGTASSIVVGGANTAWDKGLSVKHLLRDTGVVMLQREVPEEVNLAIAEAAVAAGVPVLLDIGGEDRPITDKMLRLVDYLCPNESELQRLTEMPTATEEQVITAAKTLIKRGSRNVLVTLAERGSLLVQQNGTTVRQEALAVPGGTIVDGTAAGDAFRAAFAVALVEKLPIQQCLQVASAAGAIAVSKMGAVPSLPTRGEVLALLPVETQALLQTNERFKGDTNLVDRDAAAEEEAGACGEDGISSSGPGACKLPAASFHSLGSAGVETRAPKTMSDTQAAGGGGASTNAAAFPYKFASRLNSMKARRDLIPSSILKKTPSDDVFGWIARQGQIQGLDFVDFNYPQHFGKSVTLKKINAALKEVGLQTGSVCIRFPDTFYLGAFSNPDEKLRDKAVSIAVDGCRWAADLGARDLIVWSPYDGYDYNFQVNYLETWKWTVEAFQKLADGCPQGKKKIGFFLDFFFSFFRCSFL